MFTKTPKSPDSIQKKIDELVASLKSMDVTDPKYSATIDQIDKLSKIANSQKKQSFSPDAVLAAGVNLLGIVLIMNHERLHVVTTKALGFIVKSKF